MRLRGRGRVGALDGRRENPEAVASVLFLVRIPPLYKNTPLVSGRSERGGTARFVFRGGWSVYKNTPLVSGRSKTRGGGILTINSTDPKICCVLTKKGHFCFAKDTPL